MRSQEFAESPEGLREEIEDLREQVANLTQENANLRRWEADNEARRTNERAALCDEIAARQRAEGEAANLRRQLAAKEEDIQRLQSSPAPVVGGVPELTLADVIQAVGTVEENKEWETIRSELNAKIASRLSSIKPGVVVPREKLEQLVRRFVDLSGEMARIRGICEADTRRAQDANFRAQATTSEGGTK